MCRTLPNLLHKDEGYSELLSIWNQHSPRVYISVVLCFPCDDRLRDDAAHHLETSLRRLSRSRPLFAGRLYTSGPGQISVRRAPFYTIPFDVCVADKEAWPTYQHMRDEGFPPSLFIDPWYARQGDPERASEPLPVSRVQARFVEGGMLLSVFLHHSIMDGQSLGIFLECLAAQTRLQQGPADHPSEQKIALSAPRHYYHNLKTHHHHHHHNYQQQHQKGGSDLRAQFQRLAAKCPEYTILPDFSGPTQPRYFDAGTPMNEIERTGRIFVFSNERLEALRELVVRIHASDVSTSTSGSGSSSAPARSPTLLPTTTTCYTALAALTFAHVTRARRVAENYLLGSNNSMGGTTATATAKNTTTTTTTTTTSTNPKSVRRAVAATATTAQLWNSVNWRFRGAFQDATKDYFGNAALPAVTRVATDGLAAACEDDAALARTVLLVRETIDGVDQAYVHKRLAMLAAAPDPRLIGLKYDPRAAEALAFNTWRHFGADAEWHVPGCPARKAHAIRRAHGGWNLGTALILPAQAGSTKQELFVSLSVKAMERLCNDERWMRWVDRVIG